MYKKERYIDISLYENEAEDLCDSFLRGDNLSENLSDYILKLFSRENTLSYTDILKTVKNILSTSETIFFNNVLYINNNIDLKNEEKIILIRYINICHNSKKFIIVYNNDIIYIPEHLINFEINTIINFVNRNYIDFKNIKRMKDMELYIKKLIIYKLNEIVMIEKIMTDLETRFFR